jgi:short-subunit dehydrogenase
MRSEDKLKLIAGAAFAGSALLYLTLLKRSQKYTYQDKVVLITGGSRGLGLEMARLLAARGAKLALAARDHEVLEKAKSELAEKWNAEVYTYALDLRDTRRIPEMVAAVQDRYGKIDVLINSIGMIQIGPENCMTAEDYDEALKTNFWAPFHTVQAVLPGMKARKTGRIVNISSIGGKISLPHLLPYSVSKFAFTGFSEGLHAELKKDNILVTTVSPGLLRTGSYRNAFVKGNHKDEFAIYSILSNAPFSSTCSRTAAKKIINGVSKGRPEIIISFSAKLATMLQALCPQRAAFWFSLANELLPASEDKNIARGYESESRLSSSCLTLLGKKAARRNNEVPVAYPSGQA